MKKPSKKSNFTKKPKLAKKPKLDNKTDVVYVRYLLEDMEAVSKLIPKDEKVELNDDALNSVLAAVKKVNVRAKSISKIFKQKYVAARFDKVEGVSQSILKKGKESPRFRYSFLVKEFSNCRKEIANTIVSKPVEKGLKK